MANAQPTHFGYVVTEKRGRSYWTKVGALFPHKDGEGFHFIIPEGISVSGQITFRKPKAKDATAPGSTDAYDDDGVLVEDIPM